MSNKWRCYADWFFDPKRISLLDKPESRLSSPKGPMPGWMARTDAQMMVSTISSEAHFWKIHNVIQYLTQRPHGLKDTEFELAPPWPVFWVEWTTPEVMWRGDTKEKLAKPVGAGVLATTFDWRDPADDEHKKDMTAAKILPKEAYWTHIWRCFFFENPSDLGPSVTHLGQIMFSVRADRRLVTHEKGHFIVLPTEYVLGQCGNDRKEASGNLLWEFFDPLGFGLTLANCKNVRLESLRLTNAQIMNRELSDVKRAPLTSYHVVTINRGPSETEGVPTGEVRGPCRQHVVRGHLRRYTPEAPLFGKYTGTYWCPMFWRGDPKAGRVLKTYDVDPNKVGPDTVKSQGPWIPSGQAKFAK